MHRTPITHRIAALAASAAILATLPAAAQATSGGAMDHHAMDHHAMKHHAMKHHKKHHAMKHPAMKHG